MTYENKPHRAISSDDCTSPNNFREDQYAMRTWKDAPVRILATLHHLRKRRLEQRLQYLCSPCLYSSSKNKCLARKM